MEGRPRGGDDRRIWLVASAASLALLAAAAIVVLLVILPRGSAGGAPAGSSTAGAGGASPSPPPTTETPGATTAAVATPLPAPLGGSDDSGPALVALDDPHGPVDVARQLFGSSGSSCGSAHATYTNDCAVTHRFGTRLTQLYGAGQPFEPLCRCEAAWSVVSFAAGDPGPQGADGNHTAVTATFTVAGKHLSLTLLVERTTSGWLANDSWCGAARSADIYVSQPPGCPAA